MGCDAVELLSVTDGRRNQGFPGMLHGDAAGTCGSFSRVFLVACCREAAWNFPGENRGIKESRGFPDMELRIFWGGPKLRWGAKVRGVTCGQ